MFRWKKEPEQETHNTISLKCFLCQGNWTGTNKKELRTHLEKGHKVVFWIKELIELSESQPGKMNLAAATSDEEDQNLAVTKTSVETNSGGIEKSQYFIVD